MENEVQKIRNEFSGLCQSRSSLEKLWQLVNDIADPANAFITRDYDPSRIINKNVYTSILQRHIPKFVAAMQNSITPSNQVWHKLAPPVERLSRNYDVRMFFEKTNEILFAQRYKPLAGFNKSIIKNYYQEAKLGLMIQSIDQVNSGLRYRYLNAKNVYFYRGDQALERIYIKECVPYFEFIRIYNETERGNLPQGIVQAGERDSYSKVNLLHYCYEMDYEERKEHEIIVQRLDGSEIAISQKYRQVTILQDVAHDEIIREQFFSSMPYQVCRYREMDYDQYSTSPVIDSLIEVMQQNRLRKMTINGVERSLSPVMLASIGMRMNGYSNIPGSINYGGLDAQGRPLASAVNTAGDLNAALTFEGVTTGEIAEYFLTNLFVLLGNDTTKTLGEVQQRAFERNLLMSVYSFPVENEFLDPMIRRELDILGRSGFLPEVPKALMDYAKDNGGDMFIIEYAGGTKRAQDQLENSAIMETAQAAAVLSNSDPALRYVFNGFKSISRFAQNNGTPVEDLVTEEEYMAVKNQTNQIQAGVMGQAVQQAGGAA